ncbi:MAG: D-alanyl-D-alanine carboxypeptidase family protein [Ruminococcaceae bacterium]|nr:D-alanyl-D-alanine carboxypeptidase family protein [Oscillospiraceae bacterium]
MNDNKQSNEPRNVGFIDDYSNDSVHNRSTVRKTEGKPVYSNPLENETKPKRKITKMSRKRYRKQNAALIISCLFLAAVASVSLYFIIAGPEPETNSPTGEFDIALDSIPETEDTAEADTEAVTEEKEPEREFITLSRDEIHKGNLILVNYKHEYVFPEEDILVSMYKTSDAFSVNTTETYFQKEALDSFCTLMEDLYENSGCNDVLVVSAFRTVEKQQEIYQDRLDRYGSEYAASYVADPGYSEHHTGLALDLTVYADDGLSYDIDTYENTKWFMENFTEYGFILRYPEDKAAITAINFESWHYRYVSLPHSLIMEKLNLCHEEYTDYLKDFTVDTKILTYNKSSDNLGEISEDNIENADSSYLIYYVPASDGDTTEVPLLKNTEYTVSGNNVDGFIVTARLKG